MALNNCPQENIFINLTTWENECLPGVLIPPAGYSQPIPEVTVTPGIPWGKIGLFALAALVLYKVVDK